MNVLIACEFSGVVRDAFMARGHNAISCDLEATTAPGPHIQGDVLPLLEYHWDLLIAPPPCRYLAASGARWWRKRRLEQWGAIEFVRKLLAAPIPRIALENPVGALSKSVRPPDQIIQPWQFGHGDTKATCLWLKGLRPLRPTDVVAGREARIHRMPPSPDRSRKRSITYAGIAAAMADQWGDA